MRLLAAAAAFALSAGVAQATTITVDTFSVSKYNTALGALGPVVVTEDFESYKVGNVGTGETGDGFQTAVGRFFTQGGTGTGGTVGPLDGTKLAVRTGTVFGRSSTTDLLANGNDDPNDKVKDQFLDSNDTFGIRWAVNVGSAFNSLIFVLTDATDVGARMRISASGAEKDVVLKKLDNGNRQLVIVNFGGFVPLAEISFFNSNKDGKGFINDGFSLDDIAVSAVPLPAPAFMLLAGLAGLAAFRRKRAAA